MRSRERELAEDDRGEPGGEEGTMERRWSTGRRRGEITAGTTGMRGRRRESGSRGEGGHGRGGPRRGLEPELEQGEQGKGAGGRQGPVVDGMGERRTTQVEEEKDAGWGKEEKKEREKEKEERKGGGRKRKRTRLQKLGACLQRKGEVEGRLHEKEK